MKARATHIIPIALVIIAFTFAPTSLMAQQVYQCATSDTSWEDLIDAKKYDDTRKLCTGCLTSPNNSVKAEGYKCLANLEIIGMSASLEAFDRGIVLFEKAIPLTPDNIALHVSRLALLVRGGRYSDMPSALTDSLARYHGSDALKEWKGFIVWFLDARQYNAGIAYFNVLKQHYPANSEIIFYIGVMLYMQKNYSEAEVYLKKSIKLSPNDPLNNRFLGKLYEDTGKYKLADKYYSIAFKSDTIGSEFKCKFANFLESKLGQKDRACEVRQANCPMAASDYCKQKQEMVKSEAVSQAQDKFYDLATRALANLDTPEGQEYSELVAEQNSAVIRAKLRTCSDGSDAKEGNEFIAIITVSEHSPLPSRVEVNPENKTSLCVRDALLSMEFPLPPTDSYLLYLELAKPDFPQ